MMKHLRGVVSLALLIGVTALGAMPPKDTAIAVVSKVILDVMRKPAERDWQPAKRGEVLASGERLRTGEKSIAVIKFKDNSMLRVREKSEVLIVGTQEGTTFSKSTMIERGVIGFNVKKQKQGEEFRLTSPTSVAAIRGTSGQFAVSDSSDKLIVLEGLVRLLNKSSAQSIDVAAGYTGVSTPDGKVELRVSTPEERRSAEVSVQAAEQENRLDIELNDGKGNQKKMEIRYK
ncbi:MAG: hypothetical protein C4326_01710 [Ignavibacteria bacterium]